MEALGLASSRGLVVSSARERRFFIEQLSNALVLLLQAAWQIMRLDTQLAPRLVDEVHGLVRQQSLGNIPAAELHRGLHRIVGVRDLVVLLILWTECAHHLDGRFLVWLFDEDGLEAAFEGCVLLDVLAVFRFRRRSDGLEFAARQCGLHHVACVDGSFCGPRADDRVQLVDEEDHLAVRLSNLVHHAFEPFLELAAELAAGDHAPDVEREHPAAFQLVRRSAVHDLLRQPLDDGSLADSRAPNQNRVVLRPPNQRLHHALNLIVPSNHGVELPSTRQIRQIHAEPLQRLVPALRLLVMHSMTPAHVSQSLVYRFDVNPDILQERRGRPLVVLCNRDQQMLRTDELVIEALRLGLRFVQHVAGPRSHEYLVRLVFQLWTRLQHPMEAFARGVDRRPQGCQDPAGRSVGLLENRHEHMLDIPLAMTIASHHLMGLPQDLLRLLREIVGLQYHLDTSHALRPVLARRHSLRMEMRRRIYGSMQPISCNSLYLYHIIMSRIV